MGTRRRAIAAAIVAVLAVAAALLFGAGNVSTCLGPLGVTEVQCIRASGTAPTAGLSVPILALGLAGAFLLAVRVPSGALRIAGASAIAGAALVGAAYVALRPATLTGPTSTGEIITVSVPLDPDALLGAAAIGALAAGLLAVLLSLRASRDRASSRTAG